MNYIFNRKPTGCLDVVLFRHGSYDRWNSVSATFAEEIKRMFQDKYTVKVYGSLLIRNCEQCHKIMEV